MPKLTAPLLSFDARGAIAKTQVYSNWRGIPYARRYTVPNNPQTTEQTLTRTAFAWLNAVYKFAPAGVVAPWDSYATGRAFLGRNGFISQNLSNLRSAADITALILSPGSRSGIPASAISLVAGAGQIAATLTAPSLPTGWSIVNGWAAAIRDQDPNTGILYTVTAGSDATTPYVITLTGLTAAQLYVVCGWFEFLRPDGATAYGQSISDTDTPT